MADNILRIGAEFDVSQIVAGSKEAAESFDVLGGKVGELSDKTLNLLYPTEEVAKANAEEAATSENLSGAIAALTAAIDKLTVAKTANKAATGGMTSAMGAARVEMGALEGSAGMMAGGLARVAAQSEILAPLIQAAFVPFALAAFADILYEVGDKLYHVYENVILLKDAIAALDKASESEAARAATLNYEYETAYARRLEATGHLTEAAEEMRKAESDKPLALPKIDDKEFKQFSSDFVSFLQAVHTSADAPTVISRIQAEAKSAADQLVIAKQKAQEANEAAALPSTGEGADVATAGAAQRANADVTELTKKLQLLQGMIGEVQSQAGIDFENTATRIAEASKKASTEIGKENTAIAKATSERYKLSDSATRVVDSYNKLFESEVRIQTEENQMFASSQEKDVDASIRTAQKEVEARVKYQEETAKLFEQNSLEQIRAQEGTVTATASLLKTELAGVQTTGLQRIAITEQIDAQELASKEELERKKLAATMAGIEAEKAVLLGGQTEQSFVVNADPAQLSKLAALNAQIVAAQASFNGAMNAFYIQDANNEQAAQNKKVAYWQSSLNQTNTGFQNLTRQILQGNETIQRAFYQLGAGLVLSIVTSLEKMTLEYIEHKVLTLAVATSTSQTEVALTATTAAEKKTIESASTLSSLAKSAVDAAGKTWAAVAAIPIVGPFLAPEAAAGAFAGVIALGALAGAEAGAEIPHDMPIFAHAGETVAPKPLSAELHNLAPNIQKFNSTVNNSSTTSSAAQQVGGDTNVHVNFSAIDAKGVSDFIHGNKAQFLKAMKTAVRNGVRPR